MARPGLRKVFKYSEEFKATVVALSQLEGVAVQDVAAELDIHPFMLSLWRRQVREGKLMAHRPKVADEKVSAELRALRKLKKDYERLKEEHDILKKPSGSLPHEGRDLRVHRSAPEVNRISTMCRVYSVTRGGYYAWRNRPVAKSKRENERVLEMIRRIHSDSDGSYGSPRVHAALLERGERISENRAARIMRANQIRARIARLYRPNPGHHAFFANIPNHCLQQLADRPNRVWVGDVTYLKVGPVWLYLAVIMDKYSRRILGWAISRWRSTQLVINALNQAVQARRPTAGTIFHSDRGIEYVSHAYRHRLAQLGLVQSMNRPRRMNDHAFMESFFHSFKADKYHGRHFDRPSDLIQTVKQYMPFYNTQRLHSSIGYLAPASYEAQCAN